MPPMVRSMRVATCGRLTSGNARTPPGPAFRRSSWARSRRGRTSGCCIGIIWTMAGLWHAHVLELF